MSQTLSTLFRGSTVGGGSDAGVAIETVQVPASTLNDGDVIEVTTEIEFVNTSAMTDETVTPKFSLGITGLSDIVFTAEATAPVAKSTTVSTIVKYTIQRFGTHLVVGKLSDLCSSPAAISFDEDQLGTIDRAAVSFGGFPVISTNSVAPTLTAEMLLTLKLNLHANAATLSANVKAVVARII